MVKILRTLYITEELVQLGCIGHTLQLSIGKALQIPAVTRVLGRVRKLVEHFHKSTLTTSSSREKLVCLNMC